MELSHGGDWAGFQERYGKLPLDFSASTTPLSMPAGIREAVIRSLDRADRYPDPLCRELTAALGKKHSQSPEHILCGAGAADLLFRLVQAKRPRRALIVEPAFSGYEEALRTVDCQIERFFLREEDDFTLTEDLLLHITPRLDMLFLCSPNNPTGRSVPTELLGKIGERCRQCGTLLVLDACFGDFLLDPPQDGPFVLRSFTKWYPMAGLRLGYAVCSDTELLKGMHRQGPPWAVSAPAQAAGLAALKEQAYSRALATLIREQRPILAMGLESLGCRVIPGEANFLLFFCPDTGLDRDLEGKGILLRNCSNFPGLGPGWYRAAVRTGKENQVLLQTMKEVL